MAFLWFVYNAGLSGSEWKTKIHFISARDDIIARKVSRTLPYIYYETLHSCLCFADYMYCKQTFIIRVIWIVASKWRFSEKWYTILVCNKKKLVDSNIFLFLMTCTDWNTRFFFQKQIGKRVFFCIYMYWCTDLFEVNLDYLDNMYYF